MLKSDRDWLCFGPMAETTSEDISGPVGKLNEDDWKWDHQFYINMWQIKRAINHFSLNALEIHNPISYCDTDGGIDSASPVNQDISMGPDPALYTDLENDQDKLPDPISDRLLPEYVLPTSFETTLACPKRQAGI